MNIFIRYKGKTINNKGIILDQRKLSRGNPSKKYTLPICHGNLPDNASKHQHYSLEAASFGASIIVCWPIQPIWNTFVLRRRHVGPHNPKEYL